MGLLATAAAAQEPPRFPSEVRVVELDVAVTRNGRPEPGLTAADFDVRDAGAPQTVELEELRERYLLRYGPTGVPPDGWHPVEVRVRRKGLAVRCRPGYQADPTPH